MRNKNCGQLEHPHSLLLFGDLVITVTTNSIVRSLPIMEYIWFILVGLGLDVVGVFLIIGPLIKMRRYDSTQAMNDLVSKEMTSFIKQKKKEQNILWSGLACFVVGFISHDTYKFTYVYIVN